MIDMLQLGKDGKAAARELRKFDTVAKNRLLIAIADALEAKRAHILAENAKDVADGEQSGMTQRPAGSAQFGQAAGWRHR